MEGPLLLVSEIFSTDDGSCFAYESFAVRSNMDRTRLEERKYCPSQLSPGAGAVGSLECNPCSKALCIPAGVCSGLLRISEAISVLVSVWLPSGSSSQTPSVVGGTESGAIRKYVDILRWVLVGVFNVWYMWRLGGWWVGKLEMLPCIDECMCDGERWM